MTKEESIEAIDIIREYEYLNNELQTALDSLSKIEERKDDLMSKLQELKIREQNFMEDYRKKYGDKDIISELNMVDK